MTYYVEYRIDGKLECKGFEAKVYADTFLAYLKLAGIPCEMYTL